MKRVAATAVMLAVCNLVAGAAKQSDVLPAWPAPGARFPADPPAVPLSAERTGQTVWDDPPAVVGPYDANWYDYQPIVWGGDRRLGEGEKYHTALRQMFVRAGLVYSTEDPQPHAQTRFNFYCTNLCNQLYLRNKTGPAVKKAFEEDRSKKNLVRKPSLEDPATDAAERANAARIARQCGPLKPLGYDLRDEGTYTNSSACPFDYDFSDVSMKCFRLWLRAKYGQLDRLNATWGSSFASWEQVEPKTTDEIFAELNNDLAHANLAPWMDHREYNDDTFHAAVARYRGAVYTADPGAPVGYSGTQMPSAWGGFDFWKIGNNISWIEHYEDCGSRELIRSFLPRRAPAIAAIPYGSVDAGLRRMWYLVLHGDRGGLVWPYKGNDTSRNNLLEVQDGQVSLSQSGQVLRDVFCQARGGIPCLLARSRPVTAPVGVLYSQASIRADWPLEVLPEGKTWVNRYSSWESRLNFAAQGREGFYKLLEDLGLQYTCISSRQVERDELRDRGIRLFIVPRGIALSDLEIAQLRKFVQDGGVLVCDLMAGRMDEVGRVRRDSPIDGLLGLRRAAFAFQQQTGRDKQGFGQSMELTMASNFHGLKKGQILKIQGFQEPGLQADAARPLATTPTGPALLERKLGKGAAYTLNFDIPNYLAQRATDRPAEATRDTRRVMQALLARADVEPKVAVAAKGGREHPVGIETFQYQLGPASIVAANVNGSVRIEIDLSDSGQAVRAGELPLRIELPKAGYVTEMRTGRHFGKTGRVDVMLPKAGPVVLSVLPYEVKGLNVDIGQGRIADGRLAIDVSIGAKGALTDHVVHAEFVDAQGQVVPESVVNLPLRGGRYRGAIDCSFVHGDGPWTLQLRDVASAVTWKGPVTR
jgi:hypothetical protein